MYAQLFLRLCVKNVFIFFENKTFYILLFRNERCLLCIENSFSENVLVSKVNVYF